MDPDPSDQSSSAPGTGGEFASIQRWLAMLPPVGGRTRVGPGDDVAWLDSKSLLAISTDSLVEDVHFQRSWGPGHAVGRRALGAALSDLAASRAQPLACVVALSAPHFDGWCDEVMAGIASGSVEWECPVVGGDTTGSTGPAVVTVTVLGEATEAGPLLRTGAQPGDLLQISGLPGASARALEQLLAGQDCPWPEVRPRLDLLDSLATASAGIDLSDGLLADSLHLAEASGVALSLHRDPDWDKHVLTGGEDYELLVTAPSPLPGFEVIGSVSAGRGLSFADGSPLPPKPWGFDHGRRTLP